MNNDLLISKEDTMKLKLVRPCSHKLRIKGKSPKEENGAHTKVPAWGLTSVASLTPPGWDISIADELYEDVSFDDRPDVVGITVMSVAMAYRAYEIGDHYRKKGVPVVMGGMHASAMPNEHLEHADAVLVGEAEGLWSKVLDDCAHNKMRGIYERETLHDLKGLPHPRLDLIKNKHKFTVWQFVQAGRGCPFSCEFCSISAFWKKFRKRPVDEVIEEMKCLDPNQTFWMLDEFVGVDPNYYKELFEKMIPLKFKRWACQTGVKVADDPELMDLFQKSGCKHVYLGFETPNLESLTGHGKRHNSDPKSYIETVKKFHKRGMLVQAGFVFGLDNDDPATFKKTQKFVEKSKVDILQFNLLYPYPGTPLRERFIRENRLTSNDFDNYLWNGINFIPTKMTQDELNKGYLWIFKKNAGWAAVLKRVIRKFIATRSVRYALGVLILNQGIRRAYHALESHLHTNPVRYPGMETIPNKDTSTVLRRPSVSTVSSSAPVA